MDDAATFEGLLTRIGFTAVRQKNAILDHGFGTCRELASFNKDSLDDLFKTIQTLNRDLAANQRVSINLTMKKRLNAVREEFIMRKNCGAEMIQITIDSLDGPAVDALATKHAEWGESKKASSKDNLPDVEVPKLSKSNWKDFRSHIFELLSRNRGVNNISLTYVIRADPEGDYDEEMHESTEALLVACMALTGPKFSQDKQKVFSLLVQHAKGTEIESIVEKYNKSRDGRKAWIAILKHMESTSYMDNLKSNAMASMKKAHYKGEKRDFNLSDYYTVHSNAQNDLSIAGDPLSNGMKITHFMQGLKEPTAINYAVTTKTELGANATFDTFYNSFSAKLNSHITLMKDNNNEPSKRAISAFGTHGRGRGGRGGRGRGRFGRGRGYQGSRGRGRGRGSHQRNYGWTPRTSSYSKEEWDALTWEQQNQVFELRRSSEGDHSTDRNVNAAASESSNSSAAQRSEVQAGRAGDAFASRKRHKPE